MTDYSSVYIEALYLSKPVICFGYDIEHYKIQQDGLLYDMELAFPGPVIEDFAQLVPAIQERLHACPTTNRARTKNRQTVIFLNIEIAIIANA